jgi:hypothetical protein
VSSRLSVETGVDGGEAGYFSLLVTPSGVVRVLVSDPNPDLRADPDPDWLDDADSEMGVVIGSTTCQTCSPCKTVLTLKDHMA